MVLTVATGPDIAVLEPNGAPVTYVELRNREELSSDIATELRDIILEHNGLPWSPFFLMVSQDWGYLWDQREHPRQLLPETPPTATFAMTSVMQRYWPDFNPEKRLVGVQLDILVIQWLYDLAAAHSSTTMEPEATLDRAGLLALIRGARIVADANEWPSTLSRTS